MDNIRTCSRCGVLYDKEITRVEKYKEFDRRGCRISKTVCPVCHKQHLDGGDDYAFDKDEINDFLRESV